MYSVRSDASSETWVYPANTRLDREHPQPVRFKSFPWSPRWPDHLPDRGSRRASCPTAQSRRNRRHGRTAGSRRSRTACRGGSPMIRSHSGRRRGCQRGGGAASLSGSCWTLPHPSAASWASIARRVILGIRPSSHPWPPVPADRCLLLSSGSAIGTRPRSDSPMPASRPLARLVCSSNSLRARRRRGKRTRLPSFAARSNRRSRCS